MLYNIIFNITAHTTIL